MSSLSHRRRLLLTNLAERPSLHYDLRQVSGRDINAAVSAGPRLAVIRASNGLVQNEIGDLQYAPHNLLENANMSAWTGDTPSGWAGPGPTVVEAVSDLNLGGAAAAITAATSRPYMQNTVVTAIESEGLYTGGCYIEQLNHTAGNTEILRVYGGASGLARGQGIESEFSTPGWYAIGVFPGTGAGFDNTHLRIGLGSLGDASGTMRFSHPFFVRGLIPGVTDPRVTANAPMNRLDGPPLGLWVGGDDGDEPIFDTVRFHHDPADTNSAALGLLYEGYARTNLFLHSEELGDADWTATAQVSVTERDAVGVLGTTTANLLTNSGDDATLTQAVTVTAADILAVSAFVKDAVAGGHFHIEVDGSSGTADAWFDIAGAAVGTKSATTYTADDSYIEDWGDGWFRCVIIVTTVTDTAITCRLIIADGDNSDSEDTADAMHVEGPQCEVIGANEPKKASSYIPTYAATATRVTDRLAAITQSEAEHAWINDAQGDLTIFVDSTPLDVGTGANQTVLHVEDESGTSDHPLLEVFFDASADEINVEATPETGNAATIDAFAGTLAAGVQYKVAASLAANDCAATTNGAAVVEDNTYDVLENTVDELHIGTADGATPFMGVIAEIEAFDPHRGDDFLQDKTA